MKILERITEKNTPRWVVLVIDTYIVVSSFIVAYFVYYNLEPVFNTRSLFAQLTVVLITSVMSLVVFRLYRGLVRHSGVKDVFNIFKSTGLNLLLLLLCFSLGRTVSTTFFTVPLAVLIIHFFLSIILLTVARYLFKYMYQRMSENMRGYSNIMIYGAGDSGILTSSAISNDTELEVKIVGFIDDDRRKAKNSINGLPIYHSSMIDEQFIKERNIDEIVISIQRLTPEQMLDITDRISELRVKIKIVPPFKDWVDGNLKTKQIKEIKIEDLLGREVISIANEKIDREYKSKTILVTGAAGSIGSEIARQLDEYGCENIVLLDIAESALFHLQQYFVSRGKECIHAIVGDVRNQAKMDMLFQEYKPNIIFHASAYKHVPFMEDYPYEAVNVNVKGTKIIADLAVKYQVEKMIMISTDKAVNPTNVMGATKRLAELYVSSLKEEGKTKFITTRFGNVLGSNGSVIPTFKSQIQRGGPLTVTHKDITRYFMTIPEACRLVLEAGIMGEAGSIFVFDMGKSVKIFDLAVKMIKLSGLKYPEDIDIKIIGLRPGEKIYEEVLATDENTLPTYNERIRIAKVRALDVKDIREQINELCDFCSNAEDDFEIVKEMKKIVPEFISNNSRFAILDSK